MADSRLFKILYYLLDKGRATASELAEKFEVSQRTVYRDVEALSGAGIPVYAEPGRKGGICLLRGFTLDRAAFSREERQEVLAAVQGIAATGYSGKETLAKLSAVFQADMENWLEVDFSRWGNSGSDKEKFEGLKTAVIQHREMEIVYESSYGQRSRRTIQPLKLCYKDAAWYVKAFCLERQDFRIFKLNRIVSQKVTGRVFVPQPYPEPDNASQPAYQRISLLFAKEAAYRVYDGFDETQMERRENGDILARAEMPVDAWLIGYLLSFGTLVEVVEPKYLKRILAGEAKKIYEKNKP